MAAEELGGGVDDVVRAVVDGAQQVGGGEGRVDDHRDAVPVGDRGDRLDVRHVRVGVADRLDEERLGAVGDGRLPRTEVARVDEFHLDADPPEGDAHHVDRAAVDADGGDDLVPRAREVQKGVDHRRVPRREGKRADAAVQRGHPALERVDGGIAQAGVDVGPGSLSSKSRAACSVLSKV